MSGWPARAVPEEVDAAARESAALIGNRSAILRTSEKMMAKLVGLSVLRATGRPRVEVTPVARRLTDWTATMLPGRHRARYRAEFQSELHDLATSGARRWAQLLYTVRLFNNVFVLRAELKDANRKRTS